VKNFDKAWKSACEAAGLKAGRKVEGGKIFHDTRRSAATHMDRAGVPPAVCKKITGHLTDIMFTRYRITEKSDTRGGIARNRRVPERDPGECKHRSVSKGRGAVRSLHKTCTNAFSDTFSGADNLLES
jgi:hypothetical protein